MYVKVDSVIQETPDAVTVYLDDTQNPLVYQPGQFIILNFPIGDTKLSRPYSFSTSPIIDPKPAFTVKRVPGGMVSNFVVEHLKPGDELEVLSIGGLFTTPLAIENKRHVVLFGGGSGITPLISLARSILQVEPASKVSLVYANRDANSIIFKELLLKMQQAWGERFRVVHILEQVTSYPLKEKMAGYHILKGRLTSEFIEQYVSFLDEAPNALIQYFICGPTGLSNLVRNTLLQIGIPETHIFQELFENPGKELAPAIESSDSTTINLKLKGSDYLLRVPTGQTILEAGLEAAVPLPHSCREGYCGACKAKVITGQVHMKHNYALTKDDLTAGYVLTCSGYPVGEGVSLIYD